MCRNFFPGISGGGGVLTPPPPPWIRHCCRSNRKSLCSELFFWNCIYLNFLFMMMVSTKLLKSCGDVESNPGPLSSGQCRKAISFCQINMRSLLAEGDTTQGTNKFTEFKSYVYSHEFDVIGITETWLDDTIDSDKLSLIVGRLKDIKHQHCSNCHKSMKF